MIPKPCRNLTLIVPFVLILMQVGLAYHFHCANSYHDEQDCFHSLCTCTIFDDSPHVIADIQGIFSTSPYIREGELVQIDSRGTCPVIFVAFSHSRAPPA